jgi:hypothetical protein
MGGAGTPPNGVGHNALVGFVAGVLAVASAHQIAVFVLGFAGLSEGVVYSFRPTAPLGVPRIISQMFWGGLWGILFAVLLGRRPRRWPVALTGFLFGIAGPTLFGWTVLALLRGEPMFAAGAPARLATGILINGAFGVGLAMIFDAVRRFAFGVPRAGLKSTTLDREY